MPLRAQMPLYLVGTLATAVAGLGLGFGLGQFTISGMDPFVSIARGTASYRETFRDNEFVSLHDSAGRFEPAFEATKPTY